MKRLLFTLAGIGIVGLVGCAEKGTSVAPGTGKTTTTTTTTTTPATESRMGDAADKVGNAAERAAGKAADAIGKAADRVAPDAPSGPTTTTTNTAPTAGDRKLTVTTPGSQTVTQDQSDELTVSIGRTNVSTPVTVELKNLPKGVSVTTQELTIPADKSSVKVTIKAAADAPPVDSHTAQAVAKTAGMDPATVNFTVTVKAKK